MTDDTMYTHYSTLGTVQVNWGLKSLGRQDMNVCVLPFCLVFYFVLCFPASPIRPRFVGNGKTRNPRPEPVGSDVRSFRLGRSKF
jgi:hypothetical protein